MFSSSSRDSKPAEQGISRLFRHRNFALFCCLLWQAFITLEGKSSLSPNLHCLPPHLGRRWLIVFVCLLALFYFCCCFYVFQNKNQGGNYFFVLEQPFSKVVQQHHPEGLLTTRLLGLTARVSALVGMGWSLRICTCNKPPGAAVGGDHILSTIILEGMRWLGWDFFSQQWKK